MAVFADSMDEKKETADLEKKCHNVDSHRISIVEILFSRISSDLRPQLVAFLYSNTV